MDAQIFINVGLALIAFLGGWVVSNLQDSMRKLRDADEHLANKVQAMEVLVAGSYVKWDALKDALMPITIQLGRIENKLDGKVDKQ